MNHTARNILFFITAMPLLATGQVITVISQSTLEPIEGVAVTGNGFAGLTNAGGELVIAGISDKDSLTFTHPAFYSQKIPWGEIKKSGSAVMLEDRIIFKTAYVFAPRRSNEERSEIISQVEVLTAKQIAYDNPPTTAEALANTGSVFIQKSQMGGGSPVLRGFEANKVLIVVDGVRMNNAIYRSGHLQNVISIDNAILDRAEVVFGPGSVIYGSDALGGVMHFFTRRPALSIADTLNLKASLYARYASAPGERAAHLDMNLGGKKLGFLTSLSLNDFSDLRAGNTGMKDYPGFGKRYRYVKTVNNVDSVFLNKDPNMQRFTGYSQVDAVQKVRYRPTEELDIIVNLQYSNTSDIPRYDRLDDTLNGTLRYAVWNYGPQRRLFGSMNISMSKKRDMFDESTLIIAAQRIDEDRISRPYRVPLETHREEDVSVYSVNMDMVKKLSETNALQYGLEATAQTVYSAAYSLDVNTGAETAEATRYPDGGSLMQTYAAYVFQKINISGKLILSEGVRFSYTGLDSRFSDTTFYKFPFDRISLAISSLSGSAGIGWRPADDWQIRVAGSTGFRAPNVDDVAKVFDSSPGSVIVPNSGLRSEQAYNAEVGISKDIKDALRLNASLYYTLLTDAIVRRDFTFNGQDSILYDGVMSKVQSSVNAGKAEIMGFYLGFLAELSHRFSAGGGVNYTVGKDLSEGVPLGHIPPVFGKGEVSWRHKKITFSFITMYNGWKRIKDYSPSGEDNAEEATADGTPPWYTLNLRGSWQVNSIFRLQAGLENLLDTHYRPFSAGVSAAGRNLVVTMRGNI